MVSKRKIGVILGLAILLFLAGGTLFSGITGNTITGSAITDTTEITKISNDTHLENKTEEKSNESQNLSR